LLFERSGDAPQFGLLKAPFEQNAIKRGYVHSGCPPVQVRVHRRRNRRDIAQLNTIQREGNCRSHSYARALKRRLRQQGRMHGPFFLPSVIQVHQAVRLLFYDIADQVLDNADRGGVSPTPAMRLFLLRIWDILRLPQRRPHINSFCSNLRLYLQTPFSLVAPRLLIFLSEIAGLVHYSVIRELVRSTAGSHGSSPDFVLEDFL